MTLHDHPMAEDYVMTVRIENAGGMNIVYQENMQQLNPAAQ
jgi:hypothetical protein